MPRGFDTLGVVPAVVLLLPVLPPPLSEGLEEVGGPHGFGRGSRFSVRDGWAPDSELPPRAENGLLPNYKEAHLETTVRILLAMQCWQKRDNKYYRMSEKFNKHQQCTKTKHLSASIPHRYLFSGSAKHGLLDVCVHPPQSIVSSWDALQVAQSPVLVAHHFLHHGWVPGQLHGLWGVIRTGKETTESRYHFKQSL